MKQKLREFIENCLKIKVHDKSATQIPLKGKWQQFNYYASFGKGAFAYVPWLGFFAFNQVVTKGIYPVILYNTKANNLNFEVCYGISATSAPDVYWNVKYTQNLQHSNTPKYTQSFVKKSYTINTIEDFEINADDIIQQINSILNDFNEQFSSNDSEEQLLESLILQYASFKNSAEYDEQYKWDYASKHKNEFDNLDDFENKINGLGNYNFRPYFLQRTGQNHLMEPYNIETFKSSLKILLDESVDLEQRINKFLENLRNLLKNDEHWNNKDMMPDETDASYFLFTNDYTKYLLFNPKTAFNNFAKRFNLSDLLDKNDRVKRYIKIQDYCNNILLPKMNRILNKTHTLLDAQDFIRYVDNINSVENLRTELLEYYTDLNFIIDDTPNDYTAIKREKNIAEVHRVNSKNTKFRVIINYDKLPENMRDNCKRVPDSYGWTLNGECWVTSRNSLDDVIRKIDSTLGNFVENNYENHKEIDKMNIPLNQILYGPPGTGKTYNTIIEAMKILTFEGLFRDWYIKVYCQNNKVDSKEKTLNDYIKYLTKINEEFLKNDNIFRYHDLSKFVKTKSYIINSKYITEDPTKNNKNSYYQHGLKRYEEFLEWLTYDKIKEKYAEYKSLGQIEFVTFHQSYSYEEFVEGIKPDLNSDDLKYILNKGSFRTICDSAKDLQKAKQTYKFNYNNLSLYKILMPYNDLFEYCIENDCVAIGWGEDVNIENCNSEKDLSSAIPENYEHRKQCISQLNMFKLWIDKDLKEGKDVIAIIPGSMNTIKGIAKITGDYSYNTEIENGQQQRKAEWLKKNINIPSDYIYSSKFVSPTITGMFKDKINEDNLMKLLNNESEQKSKNAVLIIDEINRGNISKIFGELITLIEDDKRENLSVKLPYSQESFTVPKNLYIIGTMNTSDRSIASIDIALRRRFKFKEIMPIVDLVADFGCNFKDCFELLNKRISVLLDRDHQIGHSYFINDKHQNDGINELKNIWFDSILPLLNEYFYGDWEKLQALLGQATNDNTSFVKKIEKISFANIYSCDESENYDFTPETECNFVLAMQNAFGNKFEV